MVKVVTLYCMLMAERVALWFRAALSRCALGKIDVASQPFRRRGRRRAERLAFGVGSQLTKRGSRTMMGPHGFKPPTRPRLARSICRRGRPPWHICAACQ